MATIDWSTAWIEPEDGRPGAVTLTVAIDGAGPEWVAEFQARREQHLEHPVRMRLWGSIACAGDTLVVSDLLPAHLEDLERYLARIWPG